MNLKTSTVMKQSKWNWTAIIVWFSIAAISYYLWYNIINYFIR